MPVKLIEPIAARLAPRSALETRSLRRPDPGFESLGRLRQLRDVLTAAANAPRRPWKEPPLFFFNERGQAPTSASSDGPLAAVAAQIAAELPRLYRSVHVRRVARSIEGLRPAAEALALRCPAAKDLADLLAMPDDEVLLVMFPEGRRGYRFGVRGIADIGQLHVLLTDALAADGYGGKPPPPVPARFVAACRNDGPAVPAGVPMTLEARFQLYLPSALRADGTLPSGFAGCGHWLWPETPLAAVPRRDGERVLLLGPPAFRSSWEVLPRFPGLAADLRPLEALSPFRVVECLERILGQPLEARVERAYRPTLPQAA